MPIGAAKGMAHARAAITNEIPTTIDSVIFMKTKLNLRALPRFEWLF